MDNDYNFENKNFSNDFSTITIAENERKENKHLCDECGDRPEEQYMSLDNTFI